MAELLTMSVQLQHMSAYLQNIQNDDFKARTCVNYMAAMMWHLMYAKYLTHPDLDTATWTGLELQLRKIFHLPARSQAAILERQLTESYQYLRQQIGRRSDEAEQQVKARNSSEALILRDRWVNFEWMTSMAAALDEEGWGRMRRLEAMLKLENHRTLLGVRTFPPLC
jgi:hypothetical protein